ncbi:MAG: LemA family protein [Clostridia bacterium]|nr:LemA family protein [Clostridia bacterium]
MKNRIVTVSIIIGVIIVSIWCLVTRDKLMKLKENADMQWAQVESLVGDLYSLQPGNDFSAFEDELYGYHHMVSLAKEQYVKEAKIYNDAIKSIPNNIIASLFGFDEIDYNKINELSFDVPKINND